MYARIAQGISSKIPEPWVSAQIEAVFYDGTRDYYAEYLSEAGKVRSFRMDLEPPRTLRELRQKFKDSGQPVWGQMRFELLPSGKFNLHWGYENCDANGDTIFIAEEWHKREDSHRHRVTRP